MLRINYCSFSLILVLLLFNCQPDAEDQYLGFLDQDVYARVVGQVVDETNTPISEATVRLGDQSTVTDENGAFIIEGDYSNVRGLIQVRKEGYFISAVNFHVRESGNTARVKIKLLSQVVQGTIESELGGTVKIDGLGEINFPANSITGTDGNIYNGTVSILSKSFDPTSPELSQIIPIDFLGRESDGDLVQLFSFSMMHVELFSPDGMPLNINQDVEIKFPIAPERLSDAPDQLALWSMNTSNCIWDEESTAIRVGDSYVGKVPHFSIWSACQPFDVVRISGKVSMEGSPNTENYWLYLNTSSSGYDFICVDNQGNYSGFVPEGIPIDAGLLTIDYSPCDLEDNFISNTILIGPFDNDEHLEELHFAKIENPIVSTHSFKIKVVDCAGLDVNSVILKLKGSNWDRLFFTDADGEVNSDILVCNSSSEYSYELYYYDKIDTTEPVVEQLMESNDLGTRTICDPIFQLDNAIYFTQSDQGLDKKITSQQAIAVMAPNNATPREYLLEAYDIFGSGTTNYLISIAEDAGWFANIVSLAIDNPESQYTVISYEHLEPVELGITSGENIAVIIYGCTIEDSISGKVYDQATIRIKATIN